MLDFSRETQIDFLDWVKDGGIEIYTLEQWQLGGIREKIKKYADLPADFADASLLETAGLIEGENTDKPVGLIVLN